MTLRDMQNLTESDRMHALLKFSKTILTTRQLDRALDTVLDAVLQSTEMERGFLLIHNQHGSPFLKTARDAEGHGLSLQEFELDYPAVSNALKQPRVSLFTCPPHHSNNNIRTCLCIPIFSRPSNGSRTNAGVLYADRAGSLVSEIDEDALEIANLFALQAGLVLDLASIQEIANYDELTHLHQRRYFNVAAEVEWKRAFRHGRPLSILMVDLDDFKKVNDLCGHDQGDEVLQSVSRVLVQTSRKEDIVARYGGDEFILLLPETGCHGAIAAASRIRTQVNHLPVPREIARISTSLGVATFPACTAESVEQLMKFADLALYRAKENGKDRWVVYEGNRTDRRTRGSSR